MSTMGEKIRYLLIKRKVKIKDLAALLGMSASNFSNMLRRDNFSEKELQRIGEILGYEFEGYFIDKETGEKI